MTLFIVDVSRHQVERSNPLDLVKARDFGVNIANIQLDRGRQDDVLPDWALGYAVAARSLGMGLSTYRWLDNRLPGAESARRAYQRMLILGAGSTNGMAHSVDCEENATEQILRDYVSTMEGLLGRRVIIYSGRWWMKPRGWPIRKIAPYLWAAPGSGYLSSYPGDDSKHWAADYGGHTTLDVMQYAVKPIPGTGNCSLSAIRYPSIWNALTGTRPATPTPTPTIPPSGGKVTYPDPALVVARTYLMGKGIPGSHIGIVGDQSHQSTGGYHVGNDVLAKIGKLHTDYSKRQSSRDRPGSNAAMALDIGGLSGQQLYELTWWLIAQCKANAPDAADIREVIGRERPDGGIVRYDRLGLQFGEPAGHDTHTHLSYFRDSEGRNKVDLFRRYYGDLPTPLPDPEPTELEHEMFIFATDPLGGAGPRWAVIAGGVFLEANSQEDANNMSGALGPEGNPRDAQVCSNASYMRLRAPFEANGRLLKTY